MRKFSIAVNGNSYEVEVEEISDAVEQAPIAAAKAASVAPVVPKSAPKAPAAATPAGASTVNAPMPGTILSVSVKAGDSVKKGQILCVLEAMKMENEIRAGAEGIVESVKITAGDQVNTGQAMFVLG